MKTPLTVVRGNVDLLAEGELPDEARACAADAAEGARRLDTYLACLLYTSECRCRRLFAVPSYSRKTTIRVIDNY